MNWDQQALEAWLEESGEFKIKTAPFSLRYITSYNSAQNYISIMILKKNHHSG